MHPTCSDIDPADVAQNFLQSIDPLAPLPVSLNSIPEFVKIIQEAYIPYACLTVVESGNPAERFYQAYESPYFTNFALTQTSEPTDPTTGRPIKNIYYFAMKCFELDKNEIFKPIDLEKTEPSFFRLPIDCLEMKLKTLILDGLNPYLSLSGTLQEKYKLRKIQYIVADLIKDESIFNDLHPVARSLETIQWLWSSSQGSYEGTVRLVEETIKLYDEVDETFLPTTISKIKMIDLLNQRVGSDFIALRSDEGEVFMNKEEEFALEYAKELLSELLNRSPCLEK